MSGERGFTLVELLVAMVAATLLLIGLGGVTSALTSRVRRASSAEPELAFARSSAAIATLVQQAVPTSDPTKLTSSERQLQFPVAAQWPQAAAVRLTSTRSGNGSELVATLIDAAGAEIAGSAETLLTGGTAISIDAPVATSTTGEQRLTRVRILITQDNGEVRTIVAVPRISATPGCRFDPISLTCRPG